MTTRLNCPSVASLEAYLLSGKIHLLKTLLLLCLFQIINFILRNYINTDLFKQLMVWQDIVIAVCTVLFGYALIPQVVMGFRKKKGLINLQTAAITTAGLYSIAICFLTLKMYFSSAANFISGTFWLILLLQRIKYGKMN